MGILKGSGYVNHGAHRNINGSQRPRMCKKFKILIKKYLESVIICLNGKSHIENQSHAFYITRLYAF
jgi:hypothetical protein